jgi:hypothetical protein
MALWDRSAGQPTEKENLMYRAGLMALLVGACVALTGCWEKESKEETTAPPAPPGLAAAREQILRGHHDRCVEAFVKAEGFGRERMPRLTHRPAGYPKSLYLPFDQEAPDDLPPGQPRPEPQTTWVMEKVELVGLLSKDAPGVYPAEGGMGLAFQRRKTRDLDDFERQTLATLKDGEEMKVKESSDHIRVLGAIRARLDCMRCHDKPEGTLIGAFSYVFKPGVAKEEAPPVRNSGPVPMPVPPGPAK